MFASLVLILSVTCAITAAEDVIKYEPSEFKKSLFQDCGNVYTFTCLKLDIVSWVENLNEKTDYNILPGISVVRENSTGRSNPASVFAELARDFPNDPSTRLDAFLLKKIENYLNTHSIKLNLFNPGDATEIASGRQKGGLIGGGGKKGGYGGAILMAGAMMKGTLMAMSLAALAAIAGKALMTGLIALTISALIGVKSLSGGQGKTTYEIVSKPIHTQSHTHSTAHEEHGGSAHLNSGWGRSYDVPLPMGLHPNYESTL